MKRHNFLLILSLVSAFFFTSQSRDVFVPTYGGNIQIKNVSAHNIFIVFETVSDKEKMLCVEKNEQVQINHRSHNKEEANPSYYYTSILLYGFDSGILLNKLTVNAGMFELKSGSIDSNSALFSLTVNDDFIGDGL